MPSLPARTAILRATFKMRSCPCAQVDLFHSAAEKFLSLGAQFAMRLEEAVRHLCVCAAFWPSSKALIPQPFMASEARVSLANSPANPARVVGSGLPACAR
jgi:hypothetical protein